MKTETVTVKNTSSGFARGGIVLPVYAVAALTVVFIWFSGLVDVSYENRSLALLLNTLLVTGVSVLGAVLVFRGYIAIGLPELLYAGCGLVAMGSSFLFSSLIIDAAAGPNHAVTVHNLGVLFASFFHLAASQRAGHLRAQKPEPSVFKAASAYLGVLALTGLFWAAAQYDVAPAFYIPGKGTTPVRQLVLMVSVALLSVAAAFLIRHSARRGSLSLRCYGLGLGLVAMGLVDVSIAVPGSVLSWTGRLSQSLGNLYLLAAFMIASRTALQKGLDAREAAADYYLESEDHYRTLVNALRSAIISIDPHGKVVLWNTLAEVIFGYAYAEAAGRPLPDLIAPDGTARESFENVLKNRPDRYIEMVLRRKSGINFPADVFVFAAGGGFNNWTNLIVRDITARRQAQDLTQSAALFPEENPSPVLRADRSGELLYANRAAANLISQWQCPVGAKVPGEVQRELIAALDTGRPREVEIRCSDRDLSLMLVPIEERNYVNFYGRDVTDRKRADQALRESEQIYHAIGESIDYGVWICAPDGRNIYASESFLKMVGITQEQCANFGWGEVLHPDDAERTIAAWKECARTGGTWDIEHRFRGADGQWHAVLARGVPVKNEKGDVVCWAGLNLDIGRLKRTEQELEAARAAAVKEKNLLEAVMEALPVGVAITDSRGGHLKINRAFEEIWGGSSPAVRSFDEYAAYKAWWLETGAAVGPAEWGAACALRTGETFTGQPMQIERFDGSRAFVMSSASPIFDSKGKIDGCAVAIMDITGLQEAQQALRNSEEALRKANEELEETVRRRTAELEDTVATLKNEIVVRKKIQTQLHQLSRVFMDAADPIIIEDLSGKIVEMNREAEKTYGYSREELIGKPVTALLIPERHVLAAKLRERCCAGEEIRNWESIRKAKSGRVIPSLMTAFPLTDEFDNIAFVATICKDISVRKKMEAMLVESQLHLKELSRKSLDALEADRRAVARELHDSVGGSLAAIKFGLEEVAERATRDPVCGAASLGTLISHLTDTIKETKRISANLRPLMLDDLGLLSTIDWYTRQSRQRYENIRLIQQIDVQEHEVPEEFKIVFYRVMQEAVNNAAKHSRADTIYIRLKKIAALFELEVEDNGCGFDLGEVFSRQNRLSGFGLKSMQERAEICGGILNIRTQPGEGTCVRVTLSAGADPAGS